MHPTKIAQKSAKTYKFILFLITTHLWVIQIWVIPHSKANTRICLKWKDHLGLTTWWRSRANWKKYIISLYSATTWVDRFDFFTEYRLRHVWVIYDVICHDSYLMSHKIPNFSISQVFWRLYVIGKRKESKQIQIHFSLLWLIIWVIHIWVIPSFEANSMIYYQVEEKLEIDHLMGLESRSRKIYEIAL